jgi:hypothetical protein
MIADESAWSNPNQWTTSGGSSSLAQKRSDQFVASGASSPQNPKGISLVAGNMYYIELDHENGNGGYNDSVYYKYTGQPDPVSDAASLPTSRTHLPAQLLASSRNLLLSQP